MGLKLTKPEELVKLLVDARAAGASHLELDSEGLHLKVELRPLPPPERPAQADDDPLFDGVQE